ncbi:hypothetical protein Tco_0459849 [Tanacetum coccineum]
MNYKTVVIENQTNGNAGTKESIDASQAGKKTVPSHEYILLPLWTPDSPISSSHKSSDDGVAHDAGKKSTEDPTKKGDKDDQDLRDEFEREFERLIVQKKEAKININSTNNISDVSSHDNTAGTQDADVNSTNNVYTASPLVNFDGLSHFNANLPDGLRMPNLEDTGIFGSAYDDEDFVAGGDMNNNACSPIATTRVHKDHPVKQIIRDLHSAPQTRRMTKNYEEHGLVSLIQKQRRINYKDFQNCLFACFLSQVKPKKVIQALTYPSWIEAMQNDGKADEGFFVGYSVNSKAFRVFNSRTRIVEETLHITFLENKPNVAGSGPEWLFDIDTLTKSMNYKPVVAGNQTNGNAGTKESIDAGQAGKKTVPSHEYILLPLWTPDSPISSSLKSSDDKVVDDVEKKTTEDPAKEDDKDDEDLREFERLIVQGKEAEININSTNSVSAVSSHVNTAETKDADVNNTNIIYTASPLVNIDGLSYFNANPPDVPKMPNLEDIGIFGGAYDDEDFVAGGDMNNLESSMHVSPIATTRVHKDHPVEQIIGDLHSTP